MWSARQDILSWRDGRLGEQWFAAPRLTSPLCIGSLLPTRRWGIYHTERPSVWPGHARLFAYCYCWICSWFWRWHIWFFCLVELKMGIRATEFTVRCLCSTSHYCTLVWTDSLKLPSKPIAKPKLQSSTAIYWWPK